MTITCCPEEVVLVATSCCGVSLSEPACCALPRRRWMLPKTAVRSAANAFPSCVVHSSFAAMSFTTSGNRTSATKLWSKPAFVAASCSAVPFSSG